MTRRLAGSSGGPSAALGQWDEAVTEFELLLARKPDDVAALLQLGLAERGRGNLEMATAAFERATDARSAELGHPVLLR